MANLERTKKLKLLKDWRLDTSNGKTAIDGFQLLKLAKDKRSSKTEKRIEIPIFQQETTMALQPENMLHDITEVRT